METMETKNMKKKQEDFYCKKCDYRCDKKFLWLQHTKTKKHISKQMETNICKNMQEENECEICHKVFKTRNGLWKHSKKCTEVKNIEINIGNNSDDKAIFIKLFQDNEEMKKILVEQQMQMKEQQKQIGEMIPKIGNNNNTINQKFNLNVFLNEHCKDAVNLTDFIESLQIQLKDLENTKSHGLVDSIASLMINNLNEMDMYKRPIHCTDPKREILYIKDEQKWEKDDQKAILRQGINDLANKQRKAMKEWTEANPTWKTDEKLKDEYLKLLHEVMEPLEQTEKDQNRIIKKISNATLIDKDIEN